MRLLSSFFKRYRWALLSGLLSATSYIPFPPWALFFCWVPLWLDIAGEKDLRIIFKKTWVTQFTYTLIAFHWIAYTAYEFGHFPWPLALATLLLFAAGMHVHFPLAMLAARWLGLKKQVTPGAQFLLFACGVITADLLWPAIFPWNLGYALIYGRLPMYQWADVIGVYGLSLIVQLVNAAIAHAAQEKSRAFAWRTGLTVAAALIVLNVTGYFRGRAWAEAPNTLKVLQVQANIGNAEKLGAERGLNIRQSIMDRFIRLTREGLIAHPETELIVWPETAVPDFLGDHNSFRHYTGQLIVFLRQSGKHLITGAYGNDPPLVSPRREYNSLFLYGPDGNALGHYFKTHLLVFGEYTPLGNTFPILKKWNPGGEGWGTGSGPITLSMGEIQFGPQICYEGLYADFSRHLAQHGAEIFVNLTNDSWFGYPFEPRQHMHMTMARAIENRRPLIRSTNTGITSAILADGTLLQQSPLHEPWYGFFEISYWENPPLTFYSRFGAFFPLVVVALVLVACLSRRRTE